MSSFKTTIGLEVHVELKTASKTFSPSPVNYGDPANENTNVIDWGYPGALPNANKGALEYGMMAALALHANITKNVHWDRKNYFYPDNPKAYQITQQDVPIASGGYVEINLPNGNPKKIGITEMHVEEDAGKNSHLVNEGFSLVDLNRQGTPLIEIVSEPNISSPNEAYLYLEKLRQLIQFTGISDVKMQEGSMRVDINISVHPVGTPGLGTKVEIKNVNSFQYAKKALAYEEKRQRQVLLSGKEVRQQTRRFDEKTNSTILMRIKEGSDDYRYFPEPDLAPIKISENWINKIKKRIPESAENRIKRYTNTYHLSSYEAKILTQTLEMANFYDKTVKLGADPKKTANFLIGDVNAFLNKTQLDITQTKITPTNLASLIKLITEGTISNKQGKKVFQAITKGKNPNTFVHEKNLIQISDPGQLIPLISKILNGNQKSVNDYNKGKDRAIGYLTGQVMRETHGNANPRIAHKLLLQELNKK